MICVHSLVAALGDDVGGPEVRRQRLAVGVAREGDDPLGAEALGGEHAGEADGPVADDRDGLAGLDVRAHSGVVAGSHHVRERQQGTQHRIGVAGTRDRNERTVGQRDADRLALAAVAVGGVEATRLAGGRDAVPAVRAGPVAVCERGDDEVTRLDVPHVAADVLDDADELVADRAGLELGVAAVVPEVRSADAGHEDAHDRVGGLLEGGVGPVAGLDALGLMEDGCSHALQQKRTASGREGPCERGTGRAPLRTGERGTLRTVDPANAIAEFLTTRRARITPEQAGLPSYGKRRVPGLRREEVASLAGMSVEYYKRLERGNVSGASSLSSRASRRRCNSTKPSARICSTWLAPPTPSRPAVPDASSNRSGRSFNASSTRSRRRHGPQHAPELRRRQRARPGAVRAAVRQPRAARKQRALHLPRSCRARLLSRMGPCRDRAGRAPALGGRRNPFDRELSDLVGELSTRSDEFRVRWAAHNVRFHRTGTKHIHHPVVGDLELNYETMDLSADDGLSLAIFTAEVDSASQQALDLLASWTATPAASI